MGRPGTRRTRSALGGWRRCRRDTGWACVMRRLGAQGGHRLGSRWAPTSGHPSRGLAPWPFCSTWRDPRPSALAGGASPGLMPLRANDKATPSALSCPHRTAHATQAPGAHQPPPTAAPLSLVGHLWHLLSVWLSTRLPRVCPPGGRARWAGSGAHGDTHGRRFPEGRGPQSARPVELGMLLPLHRNIQPGRARWVWQGLQVRAKPGWGQRTRRGSSGS